ncbi:TIM-barrel domain-containing protein [Hymenobacter citatus]|uniref:TIM-barrel domain-containing protein n=1 Tax=Hymenobacter citatus TaxID=2763506 RepID=UPI001C20C522
MHNSLRKDKLLAVLLAVSWPLTGFGQSVQRYTRATDRVTLTLADGQLVLRPLAENAVRVQFANAARPELPELVLTSPATVPAFKVMETSTAVQLATKQMQVQVDKATGAVRYLNKAGQVFLQEQPTTRLRAAEPVLGEANVVAEQQFLTAPDELLLGLGQFQDGHFNLRSVTRQLTQVNTQIALPFIYSSKGYGLLWHQYGLTDFNPADALIPLEKQLAAAPAGQAVDATTSTGTQKVAQDQATYSGTVTLPAAGTYAVMLDLGGMGNRHYVAIDGVACIDHSNFWLPPTASAKVTLPAGQHTIRVVCKANNTPRLTYKRVDELTTFRSPNAQLLDYVVFYGPQADAVIQTYRNLSGQVPLLPQWAYGFWQCRERYTSSAHLQETVQEFRRRNIPMDVIVQDWQYWGKYGWGVMQFDEAKYPDPAALMQNLHAQHARFNISVWENLNKESAIGKSHVANNFYILDSPWLDLTNPAARTAHWAAINQHLFRYGVDSWWLDATEPENDALHGKKLFVGPGDFYRLTYPLYVNQAVYEGQRATSPDKRVCILTRSAFLGQQRYGTISWSGDIGGTWDTFKRQIPAGLGFSITGLPYWTTDIGGFFRPGAGQYTDPQYNELLMRWYQWGAFTPIFRVHGYQTETEPWKNGPVVEANIRQLLDVRYRLLPYLYSAAWQVHQNGSTLMRPLVMDFPTDTAATHQAYEYAFGPAFLVAPVTKPSVTTWPVYLPKAAAWYNFWTGQRHAGGQTVAAPASQTTTPVFVKAGAIVPLGKRLQYTGQKAADTLEIRVYAGADGRFALYEDEGDSYRYEQGQYTLIDFAWDEKRQTLTIGPCQGTYPGALPRRVFNLVWPSETTGLGAAFGTPQKQVIYTGKRLTIKR